MKSLPMIFLLMTTSLFAQERDIEQELLEASNLMESYVYSETPEMAEKILSKYRSRPELQSNIAMAFIWDATAHLRRSQELYSDAVTYLKKAAEINEAQAAPSSTIAINRDLELIHLLDKLGKSEEAQNRANRLSSLMSSGSFSERKFWRALLVNAFARIEWRVIDPESSSALTGLRRALSSACKSALTKLD
jgi:tetratricopeptide (TPR) repeat protein